MNNPDTTTETARTLLDRIAEAVRGVLPMSSSLTHDVIADAVLAVLPPSSGRAALLHETADRGAEARVRALHQPADDWSWRSFGCRHDGQHAQFCAHCRTCYPCQTITALDSEPADGPRRVAAEEQPAETQAPEPETEEQIVRAHVTTLHLIGEQLAGIESWMWNHLADVRDAERPVVGEQPDTQETRRCICADGGDCFVPLGHYADCPQAAS